MSLLTENVLILNKYYMAVQVSIVKDAILALVTGKAVVVDEDYITYNLEQWKEYTAATRDDDDVVAKYAGIVRSPSTHIFTPQVIRFPDCIYLSTDQDNQILKTQYLC